MALKRTLVFGTLLAALATGSAEAQLHTPSATFDHHAVESTASTGPMVTPGIFNYDAQMFAPVEFTNEKELEANTGFFFTFDKTLTSVSRSDRNNTSRTDVPVGSDWNWGERYQFGWMTEQDSGWQGSYQESSGAYYAQGAWDNGLRFAGFGADDGDAFADFGSRTILTGPIDTNQFQIPFGASDEFGNSFHVGELNRVFRQALKNGDYFEPYIGARYTNVNDKSLQDAVYAYSTGDDGTVRNAVGHRFRQHVTNSAIGLQLGGRHNRRRGKWLFSTDGAIATSYNQQRYTTTDIFFGVNEREFLEESYVEESTFVPTLDLEFGISFNVTRDITIRGGTQLLYLWDGIARSNTLPAEFNPNSLASNPDTRLQRFGSFPSTTAQEGFNTPSDIGSSGLFDDSYIAAGFTFGVEWQR